MPRRRILVITSFFESPYHPNRAPYNELLILELAKQYDIEIIRPIAWTDILRAKLDKKKVSQKNKKWRGINVAFPTYLFLPKFGLRFNGLLYFLSVFVSVYRRRKGTDLIFSTWAYPDSYAAMLFSKLIKVPFLIRVHGSDINVLLKKPVLKNKIVKVLKSCCVVEAPSMAIKSEIIQHGIPEERVKVFYTAINKDSFYYIDKKEAESKLGLTSKRRVVYIGNLKKDKGILDFIESVCNLFSKRQDFEVVVIGVGDCLPTIKQIISDQELQENVKILGGVEHSQLVQWINASNLLCLPSYMEGVPNVILESLACKTNILATNVGGIPEVVKDPGSNLVEPGDIAALETKIDQLLDSDDFFTLPAISIRGYQELATDVVQVIEKCMDGEG